MISSGAFPKVALRKPPIPGPVCSAACSVASPISHARGRGQMPRAGTERRRPGGTTGRRRRWSERARETPKGAFAPRRYPNDVPAAVLFDWGDTLMQFAYDEALVEAGHRAGLGTLDRDELPEVERVAAHFRERYEPFFWTPGTVEELEYPGLVRQLLGDFRIEVSDEELTRFLEAEHEAWDPARQAAANTPALLEALRARGLKLGLVSNAVDPGWLLHRDLEQMG